MSNKNTRHLHIELTPEQYQLLNAQAKQCALTKRAYIGNNINQIAHSVNAGIAKAEDAKRGLCLLNQVYELMYQIARK